MKEYQLVSMLPGLLMVVFGVMAQNYWTELRWLTKRSENENAGNDRKLKYLRSYHKTFILFRLASIAAGLCLIAWFTPLFVSSRTAYELTKYVLLSAGVIVLMVILIKYGSKMMNHINHLPMFRRLPFFHVADKKRNI